MQSRLFFPLTAFFAASALFATHPAIAATTQPSFTAAPLSLTAPSPLAPSPPSPTSIPPPPPKPAATVSSTFSTTAASSVPASIPNLSPSTKSDVDREIALSWIHQEGHHTVSDDVDAEIEWSFGQLTFELAGERPLNRGDYTSNLTGVLGGRINLESIGLLPRAWASAASSP
jgi:hypothetical protein